MAKMLDNRAQILLRRHSLVLELFQRYTIQIIWCSAVTVPGQDCGNEERLALDYQGSLPRLAGHNHGLDHVAFDRQSLLKILLCVQKLFLVS